MSCSSYTCMPNNSRILNLIQNPQLVQFRLSLEERKYYINLYYDIAENGKITLNNFPPLLGMLGTEIEKEFANKIFFVFSSDKKHISLIEYLTYIDIYHHGDENERCKVTFKLIDKYRNDKIIYDDFKDYINLILNAVKKVNPGFSNEILTDNDIKTLFLNIAKNKDYFTFKDFEEIYKEKPELISWIDYFKNNNDDDLFIIHENIIKLLKGFNNFFDSFLLNLNNILNNEKNVNFETLIENISDYYKEFKKFEKLFSRKISSFSIRNVFDEDKKKNLLKLINYDDNESFHSNEINTEIDDFFKQYKKLLKYSQNNHKIDEEENEEESFKSKSNIINVSNNAKIKGINNLNDMNNRYDDENENSVNNMSEFLTINNQMKSKYNNNICKNLDSIKIFNINPEFDNEYNESLIDKTNINNNNIIKYRVKNNSSKINQKMNFETVQSNSLEKRAINLKKTNHRLIKSDLNINNIIKSEDEKKANSKSEYYKKPSTDFKNFLISLKIFINSAKDTINNIQVCYNWISESYLKSHIKKNLNSEKKNKINTYVTQNKNTRIRNKIKKKIIKVPDQSFKILLNMIMGIQIAVQSIPNYNLDEKKENLTNYLKSMIYSVQTINYNIQKQETFFLKEYAGIIFNNIRKILGIEKESYISSISPQDFITELMISSQAIFEELISTGKSGSLLYYTRDGKFIVKTIRKNEYKFLKKILPNYYIYLKKNPNSLLPKYLGCYQLIRKVKKQKNKINFIVMKNVFNTNKQIHLRYDLKGSKIGRRVLKGTKENKGDIALKDLDLESQNKKFFLGEKRDILIKQLKEDTKFLRENDAIDYSLLIGIHEINRESKASINQNIPNSKTKETNKIINDFKKKVITISNPERNNLNNIDNNEESTFFNLIEKKNNSVNNENSVELEKKNAISYDFEDGGIYSIDKNVIYFIGIIDILTEYNCKKSVEYFFKLIRYCSENMSCVPPVNYMNRFNNYMETIILNDLPSRETENNNINQ